MKLPTVLAVDKLNETEVTLTLEISSELEAFAGHFPGNPILPGVVQIDWAVRFSSIYLDLRKASAPQFQVKYRNIIHPDILITLTLLFNRSKNQLSFTYQSGNQVMSSGQLKLGARP